MTNLAPAPSYPPGSVRMLIESDLVTPPTRDALQARLRTPEVVEPRFFDMAAFELLCAVCDRLIPQPERPRPIDLSGTLDTRLADGVGDGWRYAHMPPDADAHRMGLAGIEQAADGMFGQCFAQLSEVQADDVLRAVQRGAAAGAVWTALDPRRYFEELLAQMTDIYYSHPLASEEIGYAGMADAHGWQHIGLDEYETHEPVAAVLEVAA